jgi:hypothetical protein
MIDGRGKVGVQIDKVRLSIFRRENEMNKKLYRTPSSLELSISSLLAD